MSKSRSNHNLFNIFPKNRESTNFPNRIALVKISSPSCDLDFGPKLHYFVLLTGCVIHLALYHGTDTLYQHTNTAVWSSFSNGPGKGPRALGTYSLYETSACFIPRPRMRLSRIRPRPSAVPGSTARHDDYGRPAGFFLRFRSVVSAPVRPIGASTPTPPTHSMMMLSLTLAGLFNSNRVKSSRPLPTGSVYVTTSVALTAIHSPSQSRAKI